MRRVFQILLAAHVALGVVSVGVGIAWIILHFTNEQFMDKRQPRYAYLAMFPEIICGFLIFLSGCCGFCFSKKRSCMGALFVMSNTLNLLVWTPMLVVGYSLLILIMRGDATMCGMDPCLTSSWETFGMEYLLIPNKDWVYLFPAVGVTVGFLDFMLSFGALIMYCLPPPKDKMKVDFSQME